MTILEKIKSMNIDELSQFLIYNDNLKFLCDSCPHRNTCPAPNNQHILKALQKMNLISFKFHFSNCIKAIKDWLKAESEDD